MRNHLALLAKRLAKAAAMIDPTAPAAAEEQRARVLQLCRENMSKEHSRLLARKQVRRLDTVKAAGSNSCVTRDSGRM